MTDIMLLSLLSLIFSILIISFFLIIEKYYRKYLGLLLFLFVFISLLVISICTNEIVNMKKENINLQKSVKIESENVKELENKYENLYKFFFIQRQNIEELSNKIRELEDCINDILSKYDDKPVIIESNIKATSYCNDGITASGKKTNVSHIAVSRDLFKKWGGKFGKRVILLEKKNGKTYSMGHYIVQDLMHEKMTNSVDIFKNDCDDSWEFGVKKNCVAIVY